MSGRVHLNEDRIAGIAKVIKNLPEDTGALNFYSFKTPSGEIVAKDMYPSLNHLHAIDFFFFATLHQHGFWYADTHGYKEPLYGTVDGKKVKGSDLLWKVVKRSFDRDPSTIEVATLQKLSPKEFAVMFSDDNGPIPFPDWESRYILTLKYAEWLVTNSITPKCIVRVANESKSTLQQFRRSMKMLPGYGEDIFEKKTLLLAMSLSARPEKILHVDDPKWWLPIVDYHLMRLALRMGMIVVNDPVLRDRLMMRNWVNDVEEHEIREKTFQSIMRVMELSGRSLSVVDHAFWSGRKFCPELEEPNCVTCLFHHACAKKTEFFQPVFRTTAY